MLAYTLTSRRISETPPPSQTTISTSTSSTTSPSTPSTPIKPPKPTLPTSDVEGKDLPQTPRYTPSIRIYYSNTTYGTAYFVDLTYYTRDSVGDVVEFYKENMPDYNWTLIKQSSYEENIAIPYFNIEVAYWVELDFRRPGCTDPEKCLPYVKLYVTSIEWGGENITIIHVSYEDYALPQASATETIKPEEEAEGTLKLVDPYIRSALTKVFGNVKLYQQIVWEDVMIGEYEVARQISSGDLEEIVRAFEEVGFKMTYSISNEYLEATFEHEDTGIPGELEVEAGTNIVRVVLPKNITLTSKTTTTSTSPITLTATETESKAGKRYEEVSDQEAVGALSEVDPDLREAFKNVFGGAKLLKQESIIPNMASAKYIVPKTIKEEDVKSLVGEFSTLGYTCTFVPSEDSAEIFMSNFEKGLMVTLKISYESQEIEVLVQKMG